MKDLIPLLTARNVAKALAVGVLSALLFVAFTRRPDAVRWASVAHGVGLVMLCLTAAVAHRRRAGYSPPTPEVSRHVVPSLVGLAVLIGVCVSVVVGRLNSPPSLYTPAVNVGFGFLDYGMYQLLRYGVRREASLDRMLDRVGDLPPGGTP